MNTQTDEKPELFAGSKLWKFLNSHVGLFLLSSVGLSLVTWAYTEVSQSVEQRLANAERLKTLNTEISYRVRLLENYFLSDCADHENVNRQTLEDIRAIYVADTDFPSIFLENDQSSLHVLLWKKAAHLKTDEKQAWEASFNHLTKGFASRLTQLLRQTKLDGQFYSQDANYSDEVIELRRLFWSALHPILPELVSKPTAQAPAV